MSQSEQTTVNAIDLLTRDHRTAEELFTQLERAATPEHKQELVLDIARELIVHANVEEQFLYPLIRKELSDEAGRHALDEHQEAEELLARLVRMSPDDEAFDETARQLMAEVREHVEEEETDLLPRVREAASTERLESMGAAMAATKAMAPTRPHPHAPNTPPANFLAGPMAGAVDRLRDAFRPR